ncbi:MAG: putative dehydrogenase protein [Hyphomicrobiales bacterium]|nr:putative dehydrogenase protein [Hyphomicrobiales bacterium]
MARIGYHASHEQFAPSDLLRFVRHAEATGFRCAMSSDHFKPWSAAQGHSGYAWSWLGAALQATSMPFGVISAPGYRYHPAILAQAAATLSEMYAGRLWVALGSGQRLNEDVTGLHWPHKAERNAQLRECADIMRALLAGERVTHRGRVTAIDARLYSRPAVPPLLLGAAVTEETAEFVGGWADGLLTVSASPAKARKVVEAFRRGGGGGKPLAVQVTMSWAPSDQEALQHAFDQRRFQALGGEANWDLRSPEDFEQATRFVRPEDMKDCVLVSSDPRQHADWLNEFIEIGFEDLLLHQVGRNQLEFLETFGAKVLPQLAKMMHLTALPMCRRQS